MENDFNWHAKVPSKEELAKSMAELDGALARI
jgi:hypothetical protein